jgi:hypothetical protein
MMLCRFDRNLILLNVDDVYTGSGREDRKAYLELACVVPLIDMYFNK